ncbi:tetrapyrrole methylase [Marasmius fiardii PR-910]|nr:tetrapyrrole methylase [Marasmius fiardii PR-910]
MTFNDKKGSLTIAGSGIASIRHITLETLSHIERADKVYYLVADPATEAFIQDKSKGDYVDLAIYYDKDKNRYESYVQMSEVILNDVRAGYNVLGVFYGHPGVFVSPSHRTVAIARDEGYRVNMLPGVSAQDYMFSDIGFDPAIPGCTIQEASTILFLDKRLDPTVHNIIGQVGCVGVGTMAFDNRQFHLLVDHLEKDFGPEHKVVHYIGAVLPQSATVKDEFKIADLRKDDVVKQISTISTFYIPPRQVTPVPKEVAEKLGFHPLPTLPISTRIYPFLGSKASSSSTSFYEPFERNAVDRLQNHLPPLDYNTLRASPAVRQFMTDLALRPDVLNLYQADPMVLVDEIPGLTPSEKSALRSGDPGPVYELMRSNFTREKSTQMGAIVFVSI